MEKEFFVNIDKLTIVIPENFFVTVLQIFSHKLWDTKEVLMDRTGRKWVIASTFSENMLETALKDLKRNKFIQLSKPVYQARFSTL